MLQAVSHLFLHFEREREKLLTVVFIAVEHNHVQCFLCTSVHIAQVETVSRYASVLCHSDGELLHQRFGRSDAIALHRHLHEMPFRFLLRLGCCRCIDHRATFVELPTLSCGIEGERHLGGIARLQHGIAFKGYGRATARRVALNQSNGIVAHIANPERTFLFSLFFLNRSDGHFRSTDDSDRIRRHSCQQQTYRQKISEHSISFR